MRLTDNHLTVLRMSLVFVWLSTALVSVVERSGQSRQLIQAAGIDRSEWEAMLLWSGVAVDVVLGIALWLLPGRLTYLAALGAMVLMTLAATVMLPDLWLHPLGPLTKNVPIAAILWILARERS